MVAPLLLEETGKRRTLSSVHGGAIGVRSVSQGRLRVRLDRGRSDGPASQQEYSRTSATSVNRIGLVQFPIISLDYLPVAVRDSVLGW